MKPNSLMTANYDSNSAHQLEGNMHNLDAVVSALQAVACLPGPILHIADFGCAIGLNSLKIFSSAIARFRQEDQTPILVHNVDLPQNEWGVLFNNAVSSVYSYVRLPNVHYSATGGNCYSRIFPDGYLSAVYSSFTLHWLSEQLEIPVDATEEEAIALEKAKSHEDLEHFFQNRILELKPGGRIIIRTTVNNAVFISALRHAFSALVQEGLPLGDPKLLVRGRVHHRQESEYLSVIREFANELQVVESKTEEKVHPLYAQYLKDGDKTLFAKQITEGVIAVTQASVSHKLTTLHLDAEAVIPRFYDKVREFFLTIDSPSLIQEVFLHLEKSSHS